MIGSRFGAPAHLRWRCVGVLFVACIAGACRGDAGREDPAVLELEGGTVQLAPGERVVEVEVARAAAAGEFEPARAGASPGDVIRFIARDGQNHAIAFDGAALEPATLAFLERTGQLRGPPLVNDGASWVVSLDGAPPGDYPYICLTHGERGMLTVSARQAEPQRE